MCAKRTDLLLQASTPLALYKFTWEALVEELEVNGPTLYSILLGCVEVQRQQRATITKQKQDANRKKSKPVMSKRKEKSNRPSILQFLEFVR